MSLGIRKTSAIWPLIIIRLLRQLYKWFTYVLIYLITPGRYLLSLWLNHYVSVKVTHRSFVMIVINTYSAVPISNAKQEQQRSTKSR